MILRGSWTTCSLVLVVLIATLLGQASSRTPEDDELAWKEFQQFREWQRSRNELERQGGDVIRTGESSSSDEDSLEMDKAIGGEAIVDAIDNQSDDFVDPPPSGQPALMGRFIVNQAGKIKITFVHRLQWQSASVVNSI